MTSGDPGAFFREMLGEWEKMANSMGGGLAKSDEFTRAMHGFSAAQMNWQDQMRETMTRVLAAANMPSRAEIADLSARLGRMEAAIERIEAALGGAPQAPERPKPTRTRKPPKASA